MNINHLSVPLSELPCIIAHKTKSRETSIILGFWTPYMQTPGIVGKANAKEGISLAISPTATK